MERRDLCGNSFPLALAVNCNAAIPRPQQGAWSPQLWLMSGRFIPAEEQGWVQLSGRGSTMSWAGGNIPGAGQGQQLNREVL